MITAGLGVGLLPLGLLPGTGVRILPLATPDVELRAYAVTRHERLNWPPLTSDRLRPSSMARSGNAVDIGPARDADHLYGAVIIINVVLHAVVADVGTMQP
jgi:hypothetical protein